MEPLIARKLANNLDIKITDHSRLTAADRWYVKIVCEVIMPLTEAHFAERQEEKPELSALIRRRMGARACLELVQERHFIDAAAREEVSRELLARISENMTGYLASGAFPGRLFAVRYEEARQACRAEMARGADPHDEDEAGPADFSACFRD
jgi:hypothetical protein